MIFLQASLESEQGKAGKPLQGFVSLCREILSRFVEQHFPTVIENNVSSTCKTAKYFITIFNITLRL